MIFILSLLLKSISQKQSYITLSQILNLTPETWISTEVLLSQRRNKKTNQPQSKVVILRIYKAHHLLRVEYYFVNS